MCCSMHCLIVYCRSSGQKKKSLLPIIGLFTASFHLVFSSVPLHFLYKMKRDLLIGFLVGLAGIVTVVGLAFGLARVLNSEDGSSASRLEGMFGILPIDSWFEKWAFNRAGHCCRKLKISGASNTDDFYQEVISKAGCYRSSWISCRLFYKVVFRTEK